MTGAAPHNSQADHYFGILKNLDAVSKLDLISKLSQSLVQEMPESAQKDTPSLFGAYTWDGTAEDVIGSIRNSRVSHREIEPF